MNQTACLTRKRLCFVAGSIGLLLGGGVFVRGQRYHHFTTRTPMQEDRILKISRGSLVWFPSKTSVGHKVT